MARREKLVCRTWRVESLLDRDRVGSGDLFIAECGRVVPPDEVYTDCSGDSPTYWHRYTARQIRVLREICTLLEETYPIRDVVGHSLITPRKIDPGPALEFAFSEFQDKD